MVTFVTKRWHHDAMLLLLACTPSPAAPPDFAEALRFAFRNFDQDDAAQLAATVAVLEAGVDEQLDLDAPEAADRALTPEPLTADDVAALEWPDGASPTDMLRVAVTRTSAFDLDAHTTIALLDDHTEVEPQSPNSYVRTFVEGDTCWRGCDRLRTVNDLVKENVLMSVTCRLRKDYRTLVLEDGRAAVLARSWIEEACEGEVGGARVDQSASVEFWLTRDEGVLRMMSSWAQTTFTGVDFDDELILGTTRVGIDDIFEHQDRWLAE